MRVRSKLLMSAVTAGAMALVVGCGQSDTPAPNAGTAATQGPPGGGFSGSSQLSVISCQSNHSGNAHATDIVFTEN